MSISGVTTHSVPVSFAADWQDWHREHESARADPHGFLAISSLTFLTGEPQRLDDAPGAWSTSDEGPALDLGEGESVVIGGRTVTGSHAFGVLAERSGVDVIAGDTVIEVARRGGNDIVRPPHPSTELLTDYRGTPTYAPDPEWVLDAEYHPFARPERVTVGSVVEGLEHVYESPGELRFDVGGQTFALTAFNGHQAGTLNVLFTDATSGVTTYAANRSLSVDLPGTGAGAGGPTFLDFNRSVNLPCAYTDFATCPLPPQQNRLPFAVEAGEKTPLERG